MKIIMVLLFLGLSSCMNRVSVPSTINQCFKDAKGQCTNQIETTVKHIISIELPTVFTDQCKTIWNVTDYPDKSIRDAGYNACISEYINSLLDLIKGINPDNFPAPPPNAVFPNGT